MKKLIYIIVVVLVIGAIAFTLSNNKKEMAQTAAIAEQTSDAIPVVMTEAKNENIDKSFTAQGTLQPVQDLTLLSETQGQVLKIYKQNGDNVKAGELLAQVENQTLRAEVMRADASYTKAKRDMERFTNLAEGDAITQRQLEDARLGLNNAEANLIVARKRLADTSIKSPINGKINQKFIEVGSYLSNATQLFNIVNVSKLKLNVRVPESQVLLVKEGQKVKVKAEAATSETFEGIVKAIAAKAGASLNYEVEIEVKNPSDEMLKAGMYGTAFFEVPDQRVALVIARDAIVGSLQSPQVYVVKDQKAYLQKITIGNVSGDQVEVTNGLQEGQKVVQSGQINLQNGTKVTVL